MIGFLRKAKKAPFYLLITKHGILYKKGTYSLEWKTNCLKSTKIPLRILSHLISRKSQKEIKLKY